MAVQVSLNRLTRRGSNQNSIPGLALDEPACLIPGRLALREKYSALELHIIYLRFGTIKQDQKFKSENLGAARETNSRGAMCGESLVAPIARRHGLAVRKKEDESGIDFWPF